MKTKDIEIGKLYKINMPWHKLHLTLFLVSEVYLPYIVDGYDIVGTRRYLSISSLQEEISHDSTVD